MKDGMRTTRRSPRAKQLGVSDQEYAALLEAQGGHCALCPSTPKTRRLHVDHDHKTGAVRGLLCFQCNRALPYYKGSEWLERASRYVALHESRAGDETDGDAARSPSTTRGDRERAEAMRAERQAGSTLQEIAARYGVSRQRVHQIVHGR